MKRWFALCLLCFLFVPIFAHADDWTEAEGYFTVYTEDQQTLFTYSGEISVDDEYIGADNRLYRVVSIDLPQRTAIATFQGVEEMPNVQWLRMTSAIPVSASNRNKVIALYVTHSDESYKPTDGVSSNDHGGGIYDVAKSFQDALEARGITVVLDTSTHLPHDAGAYRRSRQTAAQLLQKGPDALIDIHRDGTPSKEYILDIGGKSASKIRLLVGRSNQNSAANKDFAKQIKAVADEQYPGLIKDIFIGKGSYNQDLMPQAILMEMGTHTLSKDRVIASTDMMATVLSNTLYGGVSGAAGGEGNAAGGVQQPPAPQENAASSNAAQNKGTGSGILWIVVAVVLGVALFALLATGTGKGMIEKIKRNSSEVTGGMIGKKPDDSSKEKP